jgi:hypothetical protein
VDFRWIAEDNLWTRIPETRADALGTLSAPIFKIHRIIQQDKALT